MAGLVTVEATYLSALPRPSSYASGQWIERPAALTWVLHQPNGTIDTLHGSDVGLRAFNWMGGPGELGELWTYGSTILGQYHTSS